MVVFSESMFSEFRLFNSIISTFISNNDASSVQAFRLLRICLSKDLTPSSILCFLQSTDLIKGKDNSILLLPFGRCCWLFLCLFLSEFSHWCSSADSSRSSSPLVPPLSGSVTTCSGANSSWQKKKKILQYHFLSFYNHQSVPIKCASYFDNVCIVIDGKFQTYEKIIIIFTDVQTKWPILILETSFFIAL